MEIHAIILLSKFIFKFSYLRHLIYDPHELIVDPTICDINMFIDKS